MAQNVSSKKTSRYTFASWIPLQSFLTLSSLQAWPFLDGTTPSVDVIRNWLNLITKVVSEAADKTVIPAIGIHCIAGLGRAPLLIAVALIEDGIAPLEAVKIIRERRPGSFNTTQLRYLKAYTPTKNRQQQCCVIS